MKIIEPNFYVSQAHPRNVAYELIERAGRICYKSEMGKCPEDFIKRLIDSCHHSVLEHVSVSALIICDRGVSHEIVRHRLASYSQSSTRYCNYSKEKFGSEITVIKPCFFKDESPNMAMWEYAMEYCERTYMTMIKGGVKPEEARSILPNSLKTEIVVTANIREWRHIFKLRLSQKAHPQIRQVMKIGFKSLCNLYPAFFEDIKDER